MSLKFSNEISERTAVTLQKSNGYTPVFFRLSYQIDATKFEAILSENKQLDVYDNLKSQLAELIKIRQPGKNLSQEEIESLINAHLGNTSAETYGVWVLYPWLNKLIHILDEEEFIEVRTNRNKHKITKREQEDLRNKKIGVIGLSVGQSIAATIVMERCCGEIRLADFDTLELSNFNRIRTGLHNLGASKIITAAREIAELDPYIKVVCFEEGVTEKNIDDFLHEDSKLDLLIEECDSLDIKILSRLKCKEYGIAVLMETNDRGMIDIERYDLNKDYPVLHGLTGDINFLQLQNLTAEQKVPMMLRMIGLDSLSSRAKVTLIELGQTLVTWPQLASSVMLGSGIATEVARRILLNHLSVSGRFYIDTNGIIKNEPDSPPSYIPPTIKGLSVDEMRQVSEKVEAANSNNIFSPSLDIINKIVADAGTAPSSGNDQPWKWFYKNGRLFLFHELSRSFSFGDYRNMASYTSLGASLENLVLSANNSGLKTIVDLFPLKENNSCVAVVNFPNKENSHGEEGDNSYLYDYIKARCTNRKVTKNEPAPTEVLEQLSNVTESIKGAKVLFETNQKTLREIGAIISSVDRMRIMHPWGNYDFYHREIRWSAKEASEKKYGMDINTLGLPVPALMALKVLGDDKVMSTLREINGLQAFKNVSIPNSENSAAMGLVTMPSFTPQDFILGGRAIEKQWLKATQLGYAYQPLISPLYFFPRIVFGNGEGLEKIVINELSELRNSFMKIFPGDETRGEVFLFRIFKADAVEKPTLKYNLEDILFID